MEKIKKERQEFNSELLDYKIRWEMKNENDVTNKLLEALLGRPARVEEKTKRISLDTNTPVFTGSKGQNVKRWISNVEDNFVLQAIPENLKMKASMLRVHQKHGTSNTKRKIVHGTNLKTFW